MNSNDPCPCGRGDAYADCCGQFHSGTSSAPTAERLMRSRYTAFALGLEAYLLETWAPESRPETLDLDPESDGAVQWKRLFIESTEGGGPFDSEGYVTFTAIGRASGSRFEQRERSRFTRTPAGRWVYVGGELD